jgi:hypothetical protein
VLNVDKVQNDAYLNVNLIDFGNAVDFSSNQVTYSVLTGWKFLLPPESHKKPFNPRGVNAFQFGVVCVHILKGWKYSSYNYLSHDIY